MNFISIAAIPLMIAAILIFGLIKRVGVYDCFVAGAKDGMESMVQIVAPLIGLLVGISMFRASGALEMLSWLLSPLTNLIHMPADVLPLALLRPVSGSGSIAIITDIFKNSGPDSLSGKIASVMMGSTETTFYTIAVYFGCVGIKKSRHTLKAALMADTTGMLLAVAAAHFLLRG